MKTIRALIVDDEAPARERLRRMLVEVQGVEVVGEAETGEQALELYAELKPELVFLDVQMPGLNGFEVAQTLKDKAAIIFVTAYDEYALQAFEVNALDYLLKPFSRKRLEEAVSRAAGTVRDKNYGARLQALLDDLGSQGRHLARLIARDGHRYRVLNVEEVDWIGIDGRQVVVHLGDSRYPVRYTLSELENLLDPKLFFRAHRSALVNLSRIGELIPWFNWSYRLKLKNGQEIDLSRNRVKALRRIMKW